MFAYIIIYRDVIGHIFAKLRYDSAKIMVDERIIQCIHRDTCKMGSVVQLILKINFRNLVIVAL